MPCYTQQRGVVLVFSLLLLLLLTLACGRMMAQNQQQFHIALNQQRQAYALASAENTLALAKRAIETTYTAQCPNTQTPVPVPNVSQAEIVSISGTGNSCLVTLRVFSQETDNTPRQLISAYFVNTHRQLNLKEMIEK
ncbi:MAG TPA: hypothetical protein DF614_01275 [Methylococcaceae bacterium]|nr:hypothetical protein [Methylococcaceae bacterium]